MLIYDIAFVVVLLALGFTAIYVVWWTSKQEREQERKQEGR